MASDSKKLQKLKMPAKRQDREEEFDLAEESGDSDLSEAEMDPNESAEEMDFEMEAMPSGSDLDAISDEELLAELKKRGLSASMEGAEELEESDSEVL